MLILILSLLMHQSYAHFSVEYPYWRGDSFLEPASQYTYPCAGVNQSTSGRNRTMWPLTGGSLSIGFHHQSTYFFINLGLGSNATNFNISLTPQPLNETGNGTLCFPEVLLPSGLDLPDGTNASIQVVTVGHGGTALYNCADITLSNTASLLLSEQCRNDTGMSVVAISQAVNDSTMSSSSTASHSSTATATSGASETLRMDTLGFIGVLAAVAFGIGNIAR